MKKKRTIIISEIGINHCGKLSLAKKLVDESIKAGANIVKFQTFELEQLVRKKAPLMQYQLLNMKESISQFNMLKNNSLTHQEQTEIFRYCKKKKIKFMSTPYDIKSAQFLIKLGLKDFKIASTDVTNIPLLRYLLDKNKKLIISTGATTLEELKYLFRNLPLKKYKKNIKLMHCVSFYPCPVKYINLNVINNMKLKFKVPVGFSDHTLSLNTGAFAAICGAQIVEKHITMNRNFNGPDHKSSLLPKEFKEYVLRIREAEDSLGNQIKKIEKVEKKIKLSMQKSLVIKKTLKKNHILRNDDLLSMRPGTGISPIFIDKLVGKKIIKDKKKNSILNWKDIEKK
jgi:hypothetical protein